MAEKEKVYEYEKTYKNVVKSKSGKVYVYYKPRKIKVKKQLKEMVKVVVLFYITTQSGTIIIYKTSFFGKSATHQKIKDYLRDFIEKENDTSIYRYYKAGWTKISIENFRTYYDKIFPQNDYEMIEIPEGYYKMDANEVLLNRKYDEFKENIKSFAKIHDYKNTILKSKEYRIPADRELKGSKKGLKTIAKKAIARFSSKQEIERLRRENERLRKEIEKLKKQTKRWFKNLNQIFYILMAIKYGWIKKWIK